MEIIVELLDVYIFLFDDEFDIVDFGEQILYFLFPAKLGEFVCFLFV